MITKVSIQNYRSLTDVTFSFDPGINIITGNSDSGKSSVVRSLRDLFYSTTGSDHVTYNQESAVISCIIDGKPLTYVKGKDNRYTFGNQDFQDFGRGVPEEIVSFLNVQPLDLKYSKQSINIQSQIDPPFILSSRPAENAEIVSSCSGELLLLSVLDEVNKDIRILKQESDSIAEQLNGIEADLQTLILVNLDKVEALVSNLDQLLETYIILSRVYLSTKELESVRLYAEAFECVGELVWRLDSLDLLIGRYGTILSCDDSGRNLRRSLHAWTQELDVVASEIEENQRNLEKLMDRVGICPTCNQPFTK